MLMLSITVMERLELLRTERPSAPDASGILSMDTQAPIAEWGNTEANLGFVISASRPLLSTRELSHWTHTPYSPSLSVCDPHSPGPTQRYLWNRPRLRSPGITIFQSLTALSSYGPPFFDKSFLPTFTFNFAKIICLCPRLTPDAPRVPRISTAIQTGQRKGERVPCGYHVPSVGGAFGVIAFLNPLIIQRPDSAASLTLSLYKTKAPLRP